MKAKKSLGQHFLRDENIAQRIVFSFLEENPCRKILEIGPGKGVLTKYLLAEKNHELFAVELDARMIDDLLNQFPVLKEKIFNEDILHFDFQKISDEDLGVIGNFPYNISSQILFKVLENKNQILLVVGMFQKEVAKRITSSHNSKAYGILSVLMQSFFDCDYLFDVDPKCFVPPPKVNSGVIRLKRKQIAPQICDEPFFFKLVKAGFGKRRKTLRNCLREFIVDEEMLGEKVFDQRAEQLSVSEWIHLSNRIFQSLPK